MGDPADNQLDAQLQERRQIYSGAQFDAGTYMLAQDRVFKKPTDALPPVTGSSLDINVAIDAEYADVWARAVARPTMLRTQFVEMPTLQETSTPEYAHIGVFGRAEPIRVYAGTSARDIPMTFVFIANSIGDVDRVKDNAMWLDSLKYPYFGDGGAQMPPPPVILVIGQHRIRFRAIVTNCVIEWGGGWTNDVRPHQATVQVMFSSCSAWFNGGPSRAYVPMAASGDVATPLPPVTPSRYGKVMIP